MRFERLSFTLHFFATYCIRVSVGLITNLSVFSFLRANKGQHSFSREGGGDAAEAVWCLTKTTEEHSLTSVS